MDNVITTQLDAIRTALAEGASLDDQRAGALACRTLLAVLESQRGHPLGATLPATAPTATASLAAALPQLGQLNVDQVLDLVIVKLRSFLPADAAPAARVYQVPALRLPGAGGP